MKAFLNSLFFVFCATVVFSQDDSLFIEDFYGRQVVYGDVGFSNTPFSIKYPYSKEISRIHYKSNFKPSFGVGFSYKWFSLRVGLPILGYLRDKDLYGKTKQYNIGFDYTFKKVHFDFEFRSVQGYAMQDAIRWDSTLTEAEPNKIYPSIGILNFSLNAWYFNDKHFKVGALTGKRAHYTKRVHTWYVKGTVNVFGTDNNGVSLTPTVLQDPNNSKTQATTLSAFDIGAIPGYAYVNRFKNWQYAGWLGFGGVIQSKFYTVDQTPKGFLGIAPRYDIRLMGGFSKPEYFIFLLTEFDNKSIRFSDLIYRQYYYSVKLVGGYRFKENPLKRKKKKA